MLNIACVCLFACFGDGGKFGTHLVLATVYFHSPLWSQVSVPYSGVKQHLASYTGIEPPLFSVSITLTTWLSTSPVFAKDYRF